MSADPVNRSDYEAQHAAIHEAAVAIAAYYSADDGPETEVAQVAYRAMYPIIAAAVRAEAVADESPATLAQVITSARRSKHLSLRALAEAAEISFAFVHKLELEKVLNPSPHILRRVAAALDLEYLHLMMLAGYLTDADLLDPVPVATPPAEPAETSTGKVAPVDPFTVRCPKCGEPPFSPCVSGGYMPVGEMPGDVVPPHRQRKHAAATPPAEPPSV